MFIQVCVCVCVECVRLGGKSGEGLEFCLAIELELLVVTPEPVGAELGHVFVVRDVLIALFLWVVGEKDGAPGTIGCVCA